MPDTYAISVHSGDGSMSEGFDSRGAIGFWADYASASTAASKVYEKLAAVDSHFAREYDCRVIKIESIDTAADNGIDALVDKITEGWRD